MVQFLAERLHLPPLLGLPLHPEDDQVWAQSGQFRNEHFDGGFNRRANGVPLVYAPSGLRLEDTQLHGPAGRTLTGSK